jgi:hypothetical protein
MDGSIPTVSAVRHDSGSAQVGDRLSLVSWARSGSSFRSGRSGRGGDRPFVGESEQLDRARHVLLATDPVADPTAVGEHVVPLRLSLRDELLADADGKREIGQVIAVEMTDLPPAEPKLEAAETMRRRFDAGPTEHFLSNLVGNGHCTNSQSPIQRDAEPGYRLRGHWAASPGRWRYDSDPPRVLPPTGGWSGTVETGMLRRQESDCLPK